MNNVGRTFMRTSTTFDIRPSYLTSTINSIPVSAGAFELSVRCVRHHGHRKIHISDKDSQNNSLHIFHRLDSDTSKHQSSDRNCHKLSDCFVETKESMG